MVNSALVKKEKIEKRFDFKKSGVILWENSERCEIKRAVGYLRRSTDKQEQSLEDQKREIISFAAHENIEITGWYTDDAISGAFSENRSQFQELIRVAQLKDRKFDYIIAYDVSRFSRGDKSRSDITFICCEKRALKFCM